MVKRTAMAGVSLISGFGLNIFSPDQLDSIHYATLEVLKNTGIKVESDRAVEIFHAAGCTVERKESYSIVKIPSYIVEDCIRWAPKSIVYHGRVAEQDYVAEGKRVGFSTFGECVKVIDPFTRQSRKSVKQDVANVALVCDYLDEISVMTRPLCSSDYPAPTQQVHNLDAILRNTSKHTFIGPFNARNCRKMVELGAASLGGLEKFKKRPNFTAFVCPTSPLTLVKDCCEVIMEAAEQGVGIALMVMALAGATSAVTLAGTIVTHNAEVLSALVLAQLTVKGTPCTYCSMSTIMDLKQMVGPVGAPEHGMLSSAAVKLAQYYGMPSWVGGGISDSKLPDAQTGYEYAMNALLGALAGANVVYGAGALESGLTIDFAKLVLDAEMMRFINTIISGIEVSDQALALDLITQIGPGGEFMTSEHTFQNMRNQTQVNLFDRKTHEAWSEAGGKDAATRAYEEAERILKTHKPAPLPTGAFEEMQEIVNQYELELGVSKN